MVNLVLKHRKLSKYYDQGCLKNFPLHFKSLVIEIDVFWKYFLKIAGLAFTYPTLTTETLEQSDKYVES